VNTESARLPDYEQASAAIELAGIEVGLSEIHGTVCGVLASAASDTADWLAAVLGGDSDRVQDLPKPVSALLFDLFQQTRKSLTEEEFGLYLLLPGSEHGIVDRTEAIAAWCRGFLLGLAEGGLTDFSVLSNEAREALEDLIDIAEVMAEDEADEQQEQALAEVEEYVRIAVQLVFDERRRATATHQAGSHVRKD
jgi:yecA family protein